MEPLEFDFMRGPRRGFLDLQVPKASGYTSTMTKVQLLAREIRKLDHRALGVFRNWFLHYDAGARDRQIGRDARSVKLKRFSDEVLRGHQLGQSREL
jgi:hypothetical protein